MFEFNQQQIINAPLEKVFSFFQQPENLSKTTPEWLNFDIITKPPLIMKEGAVFKYKIKLFGIPFYWETNIVKYQPKKMFVDEQTKGPYKKWVHTHSFIESDGKVIMWQGFNAPVTSIYDTISLLPLGLYLRTDITGRDPSQWKVTGWVYGNEFYKDLDGLRAAVAKPDFKPLGMNLDQPRAHTNKHGDDLPLDDEAPPANVQSGKSRFAVDEDESYVTWSE